MGLEVFKEAGNVICSECGYNSGILQGDIMCYYMFSLNVVIIVEYHKETYSWLLWQPSWLREQRLSVEEKL